MSSRRGFLKMLSMAAVASVLPEVPTSTPTPHIEKISITSTGFEGIGVGSIERFRISSSGFIGIGTTNPLPEFKLNI